MPLPLNGIIARPGTVHSFTVALNSSCLWGAEPQESWISLITAAGTGGQQLRFTVTAFPGASGQIPIRTSSGRYLLQVWQ
ncbi:MAG: hypothetical protein ACT4QD_18420 [Acidobacteriota bacterium]